MGTIFSVERPGSGAEVVVNVERGRVSVSGGSLGSERVMVDAGHELKGRPTGFDVSDIPAAAPLPPAPEGAAAVESEHGPAVGAPANATDDSAFVLRYRMRDYRGALEAAERSGFSGLLDRLDRKALAQLADAARLAGNVPRARQALNRIRDRFRGKHRSGGCRISLGSALRGFALGSGRCRPLFRSVLGRASAGCLCGRGGRPLDGHPSRGG